jgi:dihydrofolate reductase
MAKIVISENLSLDGTTQDPTGEEGFAHGGWFLEVGDEDRVAWGEVALDEALRAHALLLGRRTGELFGARWSSRTGVFAERLNGMPKYIVSSTLSEPPWENVTILGGDVVRAVTELKDEVDGEILVYASRRLAHTLIEHDLADELRLMIYPRVLGAGDRLFEHPGPTKRLALVGTRTVGSSLAYLTYAVVRDE